MGMREKLIELIHTASSTCPDGIHKCPDCEYYEKDAFGNPCNNTKRIADVLIANGVTIQQWIPVTERLPKPNADGSVNCVLVTNGRVIHMAYLTERIFAFCENGQIEEPMFYEVTHWMPLPEPPKGVE